MKSFLQIYLAFLIPFSLAGQYAHPQDSLELVKLYDSLDSLNWDLNSLVTNWEGVELDQDGYLACLDFDGGSNCDLLDGGGSNGITGTIPTLNLQKLESMRFVFENLGDSLPDISNFIALKTLEMPHCSLSGNIHSLLDLPALEHLDMINNELTGTIPLFENMPLKVIRLSGNHFYGHIPEFSLDSLLHFSITTDSIFDSIPSFYNCPLLTHLSIGSGDAGPGIFSFGLIPDFDLPNLESLSISGINLSQEIPDLTLLPALKSLGLLGQLEGTLPDFSFLNEITTISIRGENISGSIPNWNSPTLTTLDLINNKLSGTVPLFQNTNLDYIFISGNNLDSLSDMSSLNLELLSVDRNRFTVDDILPNLNAASNFTYAEQDSFYQDTIIYSYFGNDLTVDLGIDADIALNNYDWYLNGNLVESLSNSNSNKLQLFNLTLADFGIYNCAVTHPLLPDLTLYSYPIEIRPYEIDYQINLIQPDICNLDNASITIDIQSNTLNDLDYLWNTGETTMSISNLEAGLYEVTITSPTATNLIIVDSINIELPYIQTFDIGEDAVVCDSVYLLEVTGFQDAYYQWNNNIYESEILVQESGVYAVTVTTAEYCDGVDSISLTFSELSLDLEADTLYCPEDLGDIKAIPDDLLQYNYEWNTGETAAKLTQVPMGIYSLTITDSDGCTKEMETDFPMAVTESIEFSNLNYQCLDATMATASISFEGDLSNYSVALDLGCDQTVDEVFSAQDGQFNFTVSNGEQWCVVVYDFAGCPKLTFEEVFQQDGADCELDCDPEDLIVPSAITPNGDGFNDALDILGISSFPDSELIILNRQGQVIFQQSPYENENLWDGTFNGVRLPSVSYFYQLKLSDSCPVKTGSILLIN